MNRKVFQFRDVVSFGLWVPAVALGSWWFNNHVYGAEKVLGTSMQDTLNPNWLLQQGKNDYVLLRGLGVRRCGRGDIVTLWSPQNGRRLVIKRIVGVEGDLLRIPDYDNRIFVVPLGHVWVEGDNADNSNDSRFYGPVPVASLHGKATRIVWPPSRWATLHKQYPDINRFVGRDAVAEIAEDEFIEYPWAQARIERRRKAMESPPSPNDTHPAFIDEYDDDPPWVKRHRWKRTSGKLNWQQVREGGDGGDGVRVRGERSPPAPAVAEVEKER